MKSNDNAQTKDQEAKVTILKELIELNQKLAKTIPKSIKDQPDEVVEQKNSDTPPIVKDEVIKLIIQTKQLLKLQEFTGKQYWRALADLKNVQKRSEDELVDAKKYQAWSLADKLILVLDTFERALQVPNDKPEVKNFLIGFQMIYKSLINALKREGITIITTNVGDKFDHNIHHAIDIEDHATVPENHISKIMSKGYMLSDRVIRHSQVVVVKNESFNTNKTNKKN